MKWRPQTLAASIITACVFVAPAIAASPHDPGVADDTDVQRPADNTGHNVRDRGGSDPTADQQSNDAGDMKLTQAIRRAVVRDKSLSTNAHNVKIVTLDGVVTLRGPVKSEREKASIAAKAHKVAGVKRVDNQLEITSR